jgi:hypothetical protein
MSEFSRGPRRKDPKDRVRNTIHVCVNDQTLLDLLEASSGQDVSTYVRKLITDHLSSIILHKDEG